MSHCTVLKLKGSPGKFGTITNGGIQATVNTPTLFPYGTQVDELKESYAEAGHKEVAAALDHYEAVPASWSIEG